MGAVQLADRPGGRREDYGGAVLEATRTVELAPAADDRALRRLMEELYRAALALDPGNAYLLEHGHPGWIDGQIRTFHLYRPYLPQSGAVLDWGCNHAPDSCMLRAWFGNRFDLHSCDFVESSRYAVFHDYARVAHTQLVGAGSLPYPDNFFDAVIGSGVLEHTAMDYEALKELHRVLKPDGVVVITHLPNWLSLQEWRRRVILKRDFHRRLYSKREARQLLKRAGFYPVAEGYHTFIWERILGRLGLAHEEEAPRLLTRLTPPLAFCGTLYLVARKVLAM